MSLLLAFANTCEFLSLLSKGHSFLGSLLWELHGRVKKGSEEGCKLFIFIIKEDSKCFRHYPPLPFFHPQLLKLMGRGEGGEVQKNIGAREN